MLLDTPLECLGYRIGWHYRPQTGRRSVPVRATRASKASATGSVLQTHYRNEVWSAEAMVEILNWILSGWANYFTLGQVSPAYAAVDRHTIRRLRP